MDFGKLIFSGEPMKRVVRCAPVALSAVFAFLLSACNAGSPSALPQGHTDSDLPPALGPSAMGQPLSMMPNTIGPVTIGPGYVNGQDDQFNPTDGDTSSGGQGQAVDGIPCNTSMISNEYHVHVYLGVVYQGQLMALPDGIGMLNPGPDQNGFVNSASCFYYIHTHDASGLIHIEAPQNIPMSSVIYHLKDALDIWGVPHGATNFGPFNGPIHVFVGNVPLKTTTVSSYKELTESYDNIRLRSHEAIWLEIGKPYYTADQLPSVTFYTEY